jgi:tetratricopeptide (TPR) repeat protein
MHSVKKSTGRMPAGPTGWKPVPRALLASLALVPAIALADPLDEARQALGESIPLVAAMKAERVLSAPDLPPGQKDDATFLLARALFEMGQAEEALARVRPLAAAHYPGAAILQAHLLASQGKWKEAQAAYHPLSVAPGTPVEAWIGEAEALHALGRDEAALALFQSASRTLGAPVALQLRIAALQTELHHPAKAEAVLSSIEVTTPEERKWKEYIEGRRLLLRDQFAPALTIFEEVLKDREHLPESLLVAATFGATDARIALYGSEQADKVLETFIWRHPESPYLDQAFRRLDQVYAQEDDPPETEYQRWGEKRQARRAALAHFYVAKLQYRQKKMSRATTSLETFLRDHPDDPLIGEAYLMYADVLGQRGRLEEAALALDGAMRHAADPETRAGIELRSGLIQYQQGEYLLAATQFEAAARRSENVRLSATFNAALTSLAQRNFEQFRGQFAAFGRLQPASPLRAELALEQGLAQARSGDENARATLSAFLQEHADDARAAEAQLALAELTFFTHDQRARPGRTREKAERYLVAVDAAAPAPGIAAQADYLAIWIADAQEPRDDEKVIALAKAFLGKHAGTEWIAPVRMKLGQIYFNREDFANAETFFTQLAHDAPDSPFAESALFAAGQSAAKLINTGAIDRALASFEAVVKREGPFKLYARQEQANIQSRLSREDEAFALYDLILTAVPPPDPQLRQSTLCAKGDCLLTLGRRESSNERLTAAVAVYDELAAQPDVSPVWRNQALFKKGKALDQLKRPDEAALAYYEVLKRSANGDREYFWLYKAGFEAARLFEQEEKWKSAAGIYEKVAAFEGPRSAEARNRLKQLRLEHYLWE